MIGRWNLAPLVERNAASRAFLADVEARKGDPQRLPDPLAEAWRGFLSRWRWELFATLTFRETVGEEHAEATWQAWTAWLEEHAGAPLAWVRADEFTKAGRLHFHALLGGEWVRMVRRLSAMDAWARLELAGFARIEVPRSEAAVAAYCSKYVVKGGAVTLSPELSGRQALLPTIKADAQARPSPVRCRPRTRRPRGGSTQAGSAQATCSRTPELRSPPLGQVGRETGGAVA